MRTALDLPKLRLFMDEIGRLAEGAGKVYLVGGAGALLLGIREATLDIDLKLDPEPKAIFEGIARLKERLSINVELASPDGFLPPLPGWRERSEYIERCGPVEFFHYDFYAQVLAKLLRGYAMDVSDARAYVRLGKVRPERLWTLFEAIRPELIQYPSIDAKVYERFVVAFVKELEDA